jgi:predicted FMN-binding regulatory protein PaiB
MYQPPSFREDRLEVQHGLIRAQPLGLLITAGPSGLLANLIPFLITPEASPRGTLRATSRAQIRTGASSPRSRNAWSYSRGRKTT